MRNCQEIISIINAADQVVAELPRQRMRQQMLMHRVCYILVFNARGEILVQRRTPTKDIYAGLLDFAAGGVVCAGEGYAAAAQRELFEELGISAALSPQFDMWFEDRHEGGAKRSWGRVFSCQWEGPFNLQPSEVVAVEFMAVEKALGLDAAEVTPDSRQALLAYLL